MGTCVGAGLITPSDDPALIIICGNTGKCNVGTALLGLMGPVIFCIANSIKLATLSRSFWKIEKRTHVLIIKYSNLN